MAIGYANNILYFFVFLLVSMGLTTSWQTNRNVESTKIANLQYNSLFAKEANDIRLTVENMNRNGLALWDVEFWVEYRDRDDPNIQVLECVEKSGEVTLSWIPPIRGYVKAPRILIQSRFPFKMLRAWKYYHRQTEFLVYPERKGPYQLEALLGAQSQSDDQAAKQESEGLFRDYREFQNTDSPGRIDWRQSAKHQKHLIRNYEKSGERKILIDWEMTEGLVDAEARVSQLASWVQLCFDRNEVFALRIKGFKTDYAAGLNQYKTCMEKLAVLAPEDWA